MVTTEFFFRAIPGNSAAQHDSIFLPFLHLNTSQSLLLSHHPLSSPLRPHISVKLIIYPNIPSSNKMNISSTSGDRKCSVYPPGKQSEKTVTISRFLNLEIEPYMAIEVLREQRHRESCHQWAQLMALLLECGYESPKLLKCPHQLLQSSPWNGWFSGIS